MKKRILALYALFFICFAGNIFAADPVLVDCPIDTWTKVATNTKKAEVLPMDKTRYFYTLRDTGGASPASDADSILMLDTGINILVNPAVDIYVKTFIASGTVRVHTFTDVDITSYEGDISLKTVLGHRQTFFVSLEAEAVASTTGYMLIDLSDTTNWPHTNTDHIVIEGYVVNINPTTAFRGDIEVDFLTSVDASNGDANRVFTWHLDQQGVEVRGGINFTGNGLDIELANWFGLTDSGDTAWQDDVNLPGPDGNTSYPAGDGDVVMKIVRTAGTVDVFIMIVYTTNS